MPLFVSLGSGLLIIYPCSLLSCLNLRAYTSHRPIITYGSRGAVKPRIKKDHHAIIYTGLNPGSSKDKWLVNGAKDRTPSIRVATRKDCDAIDAMSRLGCFWLITSENPTKNSIRAENFVENDEFLAWQATKVLISTLSPKRSRPPHHNVQHQFWGIIPAINFQIWYCCHCGHRKCKHCVCEHCKC
jgi:hypothetical protein